MRLPRAMVVPRRRRRAFVTTRVDTFCAGTRRAGSPRGVVPVAPSNRARQLEPCSPAPGARGLFGGLGRGAIGSGRVKFSSRSLRNSKPEKNGFRSDCRRANLRQPRTLFVRSCSEKLSRKPSLAAERALARHQREQPPHRLPALRVIDDIYDSAARPGRPRRAGLHRSVPRARHRLRSSPVQENAGRPRLLQFREAGGRRARPRSEAKGEIRRPNQAQWLSASCR